MRKCLRCGAEMVEGLTLRPADSHWHMIVTEPGKLFPKEVGRLSCALCPECGYTELYVNVVKAE